MKTYTWLLLGIVFMLLSSCGLLPPPLTSQEKSYFDAVYRLRDQYDRHLMSWTLMEESLKGIKAPAMLAETHHQLVSTITEANLATTTFELSMITYVSLSSYCSIAVSPLRTTTSASSGKTMHAGMRKSTRLRATPPGRASIRNGRQPN